MFTGIIQGQGRIVSLRSFDGETRLSIQALYALENLEIGESIAVNGACLTVESHAERLFTAYASAETMSHTNLGLLVPSSLVNLERALALGDRLGGHIVSGHVDCQAVVRNIARVGQSRRIRLSFPAEYGREIVPKGSVTLDGVSLTVNDCGPDFLEVNVIPETRRSTTVEGWACGARVNMETDVIGKYVRRLLDPWQGRDSGRASDALSEEFLQRHGFL